MSYDARWTRSHWAFLNEPPVSEHRQNRYTAQYDIRGNRSHQEQGVARQLNRRRSLPILWPYNWALLSTSRHLRKMWFNLMGCTTQWNDVQESARQAHAQIHYCIFPWLLLSIWFNPRAYFKSIYIFRLPPEESQSHSWSYTQIATQTLCLFDLRTCRFMIIIYILIDPWQKIDHHKLQLSSKFRERNSSNPTCGRHRDERWYVIYCKTLILCKILGRSNYFLGSVWANVDYRSCLPSLTALSCSF